jgi:heat shock protein HslJ
LFWALSDFFDIDLIDPNYLILISNLENMKLKTLILSMFVSLFILQGCDDRQDSQDNTAKGTPMTQLATLCTGDSWQLQKMIKDNQQLDLLETTPITFSCDEQGNVSGMASINRYSGAFTVRDDGTLSWQGAGFIATKMGGPPERMEQEQAFLETLSNTSQGHVEGSTLVLNSEDNANVLEFSRATDAL